MPFRKAKSIELHDAHTIITLSTEGYALTNPVARSSQPGRSAFRVRAADLDALAARFGFARPPRKPEEGAEADAGLSLLRAYTEIPAGEPGLTIINLECDVLGSNLIDLRIESRGPDTPPEANDTESITYSGAFTIWWSEDRPTSPEELIAQAEAHPPIAIEAELPTVLGNGEETAGLSTGLVEADGEEGA